MNLLLVRGVAGPEVDQALIDSILQEDSKLFNEMLQRGTNINYRDGVCLEAAFKARNPAYLKCLCDRSSLDFGTAARMIPIVLDPANYQETRTIEVVRVSKGHTNVLDKALIDEIALFGSREVVMKMLLEFGASVDFNKGAALYQAALSGDANSVRILTAAAKPSISALSSAFRATMSLQEAAARLSIMKLLLETAKPEKIGQDDALIQESGNATFTGTALVELLLSYGASVDHGAGAALRAALSSQSIEALRLLLQARPCKASLDVALAESMDLPVELRNTSATLIANAAVESGAQLDVSQHLEHAITVGDQDLVTQLLQYGANPNLNDGKAFIDAAMLDDPKIFRSLLVHRPNIQKLLPALMRSLSDEEKLIKVLGLSFEHLKIQLNPTENVLLFLAIDQFEQGDKLVSFLLNAGCSPGAVRELQLREGSDVEEVTPLIWALSRPLPGVGRKVLLALLERGADGMLMLYQR